MSDKILPLIREAGKKVFFLTPFVRCPDLTGLITPSEVRGVVLKGELIEDDPKDPRGHSGLVLGKGEGGCPIHVFCAPKNDFRERRKGWNAFIAEE